MGLGAMGQAGDSIIDMFIDLARHFRRTGAALPPSKSRDPRTRLEEIAATPDGVRYLESRAATLRAGASMSMSCADSALLASITEKLAFSRGGDRAAALRESVDLFEQAAREGDATSSGAWRQEAVRVRRQMCADEQARAGAALEAARPMERRDARTLTMADFARDFAERRRPVIITGLLAEIASSPLTLARVVATMGSRTVPVKRHVEGSVRWARLEDCGRMRVDALIRRRDGEGGGSGVGPESAPSPKRARPNPTRGDIPAVASPTQYAVASGMYLHDFGLPLGAPEVLDAMSFRVPKYFASDLLQIAQRVASSGGGGGGGGGAAAAAAGGRDERASLLFADAWPSLFVGAKGTQSDVHVDSIGSHFWMALMEGVKQWTVWSPAAAPLLSPRYYEGSLDATFQCRDVGERWTATLRPGEVIFVPAHAPHRALNTTDTGPSHSLFFFFFLLLAHSSSFVPLNTTAQSRSLRTSSMIRTSTSRAPSSPRWRSRRRAPRSSSARCAARASSASGRARGRSEARRRRARGGTFRGRASRRAPISRAKRRRSRRARVGPSVADALFIPLRQRSILFYYVCNVPLACPGDGSPRLAAQPVSRGPVNSFY
jgi:hypothetical protein